MYVLCDELETSVPTEWLKPLISNFDERRLG